MVVRRHPARTVRSEPHAPALPKSRRSLSLCGLALGLIASATLYLGSRPGILFLGFPSMYRLLLAESSHESGVGYDYWSPEKLDDPELGSRISAGTRPSSSAAAAPTR